VNAAASRAQYQPGTKIFSRQVSGSIARAVKDVRRIPYHSIAGTA
jgi:hypothetical protein